MAKRRKKEASLFDVDLDTAPPSGPSDEAVKLHEAAQARYLNYALSVITSRALPDVRDGLKPVQRRILFTMWQQNMTADAKHRKCAKVVGDVMGNYHPHGDVALYETLVRMAQPFSLRYPLVDGSGNFGSLDGDSAAAMRYTECRLAPISHEMLEEIEQTTVPFRPNYDGTKTEPVVLPARIPLEMKKSADEKMIMAYLFKHTPLQVNFAVNLTCLIPTENPDVGRPDRLDLKQILWHFLHFRLEVVTRRLEHELAALKKRIHILEGLETVFDALDEIIRMIRKSDGKADAAEKNIVRFKLDPDQTDGILELKIYRLARLEILVIRQELEDRRKRARQINALLKDEDSRWKLVRTELDTISTTYGDKRRTAIASD